jgi:hypothetical protein
LLFGTITRSYHIDEIAAKYVLELESKGLQISHDELKPLLSQGLDPLQSSFFLISCNSRRLASQQQNISWNEWLSDTMEISVFS